MNVYLSGGSVGSTDFVYIMSPPNNAKRQLFVLEHVTSGAKLEHQQKQSQCYIEVLQVPTVHAGNTLNDGLVPLPPGFSSLSCYESVNTDDATYKRHLSVYGWMQAVEEKSLQ